MDVQLFKITVRETARINRDMEPVTLGIPFTEGLVDDVSVVKIVDEGKIIHSEVTPLSRWKDGSLKWAGVDFQVSLAENSKKDLTVLLSKDRSNKSRPCCSQIRLAETDEKIVVHTGVVEFELEQSLFRPFSQIRVDGLDMLSTNDSVIQLLDKEKSQWIPYVEKKTIVKQNSLQVVIQFEGALKSKKLLQGLRFESVISFYAGKSTARIDFTIHNPNAARHPGGVWDLGDSGSVFFKGLSMNLALPSSSDKTVIDYLLKDESLPSPLETEQASMINSVESHRLSIYQASSGGEHWNSKNHINGDGKIELPFKGYEIENSKGVVRKGYRATPAVAVGGEKGSICASIKHFWQNFPKAVDASTDCLTIHFFPDRSEGLFELQGGEKKTHTVYVGATNEDPLQFNFGWIHEPLNVTIPSGWYYETRACAKPVPLEMVRHDKYASMYQKMADAAIHGNDSFLLKREIIDEYGWRNFGDIYADHEAVFKRGEEIFLSHYNNQYDCIKGALIQFMRTGDRDWFQLADELARHVSDIDIYHTDQDRYQYNGGMFWHTDHHVDAATCTHRATSEKHREMKDPRYVGGGPAYSHNYSTGLLYMFWLTGEPRYKNAVGSLAQNIVHGLQGPDTLFEVCFNFGKNVLKKVKANFKNNDGGFDEIYNFDGPGRASGNALNTLLDAYLLTREEIYIHYAEILVLKCVSPEEDIDSRNLLNAEIRWMYTIFLQSLGKFLDVKREIGRLDEMFWYSRAVLLKYADWMYENEYLYLEKPEALEFPNETWAAQDLRKADILACAANYASKRMQRRLKNKAQYFFECSLTQLDAFETKTLTRPVVLLMSNGMTYLDVMFNSKKSEGDFFNEEDYSPRKIYLSQKKNKDRKILRFVRNISLKKEIDWLRTRFP